MIGQILSDLCVGATFPALLRLWLDNRDNPLREEGEENDHKAGDRCGRDGGHGC